MVVTIPNSVTEISDYAFYGCTGLTSVTISNSVTTIGISAFEGCVGLISVTISNSVTSINDWAFRDCTDLTVVTIPNSVKSIGCWTFEGCTGLTAVIIGNAVASIGSYAFNGCTALRTVISCSTTPPAISNVDYTFYKDTYLEGVLYVPEAEINTYKTAYGWRNFRNIKPLSEYSVVNDILFDNCAKIITVDNGAINISSVVPVCIYTINGTTVYNGNGKCSVNVAPGIYVVIVGNTAHKVAVR
jgi:hypothetical protein